LVREVTREVLEAKTVVPASRDREAARGAGAGVAGRGATGFRVTGRGATGLAATGVGAGVGAIAVAVSPSGSVESAGSSV